MVLGDKFVVIGGKRDEGTKVTQYRKTGPELDKYYPDLISGRYGHACAMFENAAGEKVGLTHSGIQSLLLLLTPRWFFMA